MAYNSTMISPEGYYSTLIGSHKLQVKHNHWRDALMIGSAQNRALLPFDFSRQQFSDDMAVTVYEYALLRCSLFSNYF